MKKAILLLLLAALLCGCASEQPAQTSAPTVQTLEVDPPQTTEETPPPQTTEETPPPQTTEETFPPTTAETEPPIILDLSEEEQMLLLKIGMAELGEEGCPECVALVMRTVLNRLEDGRYGKTLRGILYAQDQFTPVMDGTFETAEPNEVCYEALDMVLRGWDESRGALFYEFCEGESWHSRNLQLLTEHCNTRFYK